MTYLIYVFIQNTEYRIYAYSNCTTSALFFLPKCYQLEQHAVSFTRMVLLYIDAFSLVSFHIYPFNEKDWRNEECLLKTITIPAYTISIFHFPDPRSFPLTSILIYFILIITLPSLNLFYLIC